MRVKRRADCLIDSLGDAASDLTKSCFVNRHFIDVVRPNTGCGLHISVITRESTEVAYFGSNGTDWDDGGPAYSRS